MEIATEATFPDNEVNTERGVVIDEIKSYKDSPSEDVYDRFEEKLFRGHSLSMPILGTPQSVRATSAEELRRFYKEKFVPGSMVFTIVADIDEKRMEADLLKTFDKFFSGSGMVSGELTRPESVTLDNVFDEVINKRNHEANAVLGGYAPSLYEEKERIATSLMSNILGGPAMNSILNNILREKHGWVYGVESSYTQYSDTGIMAISLGCERENTEKCIDAVRREISKLQDNALTDRKLRAAKKQFLGQIAISSDNGESQCLSMGKSLLAYGKVASAEEIKREIEAVSADMIRDMACRIFAPDRTSCLILL